VSRGAGVSGVNDGGSGVNAAKDTSRGAGVPGVNDGGSGVNGGGSGVNASAMSRP